MWRGTALAFILLGVGCSGQRATLPRADMILETSDSFFAKPPPGKSSDEPLTPAASVPAPPAK
jgi:hypothetical protein